MNQLDVYKHALAHIESELGGMMRPYKRAELELQRAQVSFRIAEIEARNDYIEKLKEVKASHDAHVRLIEVDDNER